MELPFGVPLVIANPSAGVRGSPVLDRLMAAFRERGVEPDVAVGDDAVGTEELAARAAVDGRGFVVAVGGDGTVQQIVNGLLDAETAEPRGEAAPVLGVVSAGSGADLMRTFGLDRPPEVLVDHLVTGDTQPLDLIRIRARTRNGGEVTRLAVNVADVGYAAHVVRLAGCLPRRLGPARYRIAIAAAAASFRRPATTVRFDAGEVTEALCNVVVANGQFFGGGLHVAPRALPADGYLDVQAWRARPVDLLTASRQLRRGRHLERPDVRAWRSTRVEVTAERRLPVEADGDVVGVTPVTFEVVGAGLRLKV